MAGFRIRGKRLAPTAPVAEQGSARALHFTLNAGRLGSFSLRFRVPKLFSSDACAASQNKPPRALVRSDTGRVLMEARRHGDHRSHVRSVIFKMVDDIREARGADAAFQWIATTVSAVSTYDWGFSLRTSVWVLSAFMDDAAMILDEEKVTADVAGASLASLYGGLRLLQPVDLSSGPFDGKIDLAADIYGSFAHILRHVIMTRAAVTGEMISLGYVAVKRAVEICEGLALNGTRENDVGAQLQAARLSALAKELETRLGN